MSRVGHPKMISANDLLLGHVVYLATNGWVRELSQAKLFSDNTAAEAALTQNNDELRVVGAYVVDRPSDSLHIREIIRAEGPSINYADWAVE